MHNVEQDIVKILQDKINFSSKKELVVFDVGCYRGLFSQRLNKQFKTKTNKKIKYYLFDPNFKVKQYLKDILDFEYNYYQIAISKTNGEKEFYYNPVLEFAMSSLDSRFLKSKLWRISRSIFSLRKPQHTQRFKVNTDTIDLFCKNNNIPSIDILKIDVEGTQYDVLKGSENMLKNVSVIVIEILEEKKHLKESLQKVKTFLEGHDFILSQQKKIGTTHILSPYKAYDCMFIKNDLNQTI